MEIQNYISNKKKLYEKLLNFIDDSFIQWNFSELLDIFSGQDIVNEKEEFRIFLYLINELTQNHQRDSEFFIKIEQILNAIKENIKQTYSNIEIYEIFKSNKIILLYLFENKIIVIDESIVDAILQLSKEDDEKNEEKDVNYLIKTNNYKYFFYPEIKKYFFKFEQIKIENELKMILGESLNIEKFEKDRKIGENDSYICQLIRQDSVEEFISYINRRNISLSSRIYPSIFESNLFLIDKKPTLIEYAIFFGSIQIIRYLMFNEVILEPISWIYGIHSKNAEVIHLLEDNHINPPNNNYEKCLEESIKCHHNEIAIYIYDNLLDNETKIKNIENNFDENILSYCFRYYNYSFFPEQMNNHYNFLFFYLCEYNYVNLVNIYLKNMEIDINKTINVILYINSFIMIFIFNVFNKEISKFSLFMLLHYILLQKIIIKKLLRFCYHKKDVKLKVWQIAHL